VSGVAHLTSAIVCHDRRRSDGWMFVS